jgi:outer membrane immunogenic protein
MKYETLRRLAGSMVGLSLLAGSAASAADLAPAPIAPPPVFTWTGAYVTLQVGGAWSQTSATANAGWNTGFHGAGAFGGLNVGYNLQYNAFVLGLQAEYNFAGTTGNTFAYPLGVTNSVRQFGSVDGRLGYAFDRLLVYAIGGFAYGDIRHTMTPAIAFATGTPGHVLDFGSSAYGWDVGGGLEYALTNNITARAEYRYYNFGTKGFTETVSLLGFPYHTVKETMQTARVGLTYKFGAPAAPMIGHY